MTTTQESDDDLLTADEAVALVAEVTGKPYTNGAFRRAVSQKTKKNPAPDPAGYNGKHPLYRRGDVREWAANKQGATGARPAAEVDGLWNVHQCAEAAGITVKAWNGAQAHKTKTNPAPDPVPPSEVPPECRQWRYWRPHEVKEWIANKLGPGNRSPRTEDDIEKRLARGEWTARRCAEEADVSYATWLRWQREAADAPERPSHIPQEMWNKMMPAGAHARPPKPIRKEGKYLIYSAREVRAYLRKLNRTK